MIIQIQRKPSSFIQIQDVFLNMWLSKQAGSFSYQKSFYKDHMVSFITQNCYNYCNTLKAHLTNQKLANYF